MKFKVWMAYAVFLLLPLTGFWLHGIVDQRCEEVGQLLDRAEALDPAPLEQAIALWEDHQVLLTSLVTHEEVDAVLEALCRARAFLAAGNTEEYYASLSEARVALRIVRYFDKPTLRSIF